MQREIGKDGVLDWDENATKAFFPRGFVEVVWCEALFTEAGGLGINFAGEYINNLLMRRTV